MLEREKAALTDLMTHEMGKVKAEAGGDVQEAIDMTYYMAGEGRRLFGQTTPSELRDKCNMSIRQPIGVVGVITPWNFPIAIPSWKIIPALVCGNTVVFKPARDTPLLAERFVELLAEAGIPAGVVNIVHGGGGTVGDRLVRHPDVRVITLTGSRETGVEVLKAAADNLKHVHLELGGKNAIIVMDDADLDLAVEGILWSAFGTSGQRCTAAWRVIAHESRLRRAPVEARRRRGGAAARPRLGGRHRRRPGDQPGGAREDPLVHARSAGTRARRSSPAARSRPRATSRRASSTARRSSATSTRRCGSRRRRSSARRPR